MNKINIENIYVISDVHGCFHTLLELISQLPKNAQLIFVGDLCDRGLYSKEVIEFVKSNNYQCILGNHDFYLLDHIKDCLNGENFRWNIKDYMGGKETIENYKKDLSLLENHLTWIKTLPQYILIDKYFITHAFCLPYFKRRDDRDKSHAMMVNRVSDKEEWSWDWEKNWQNYDVINIFGHEDSKEVIIKDNYYSIDTGCVYGRKLTALQLGTMTIFEQKLNKKDITL